VLLASSNLARNPGSFIIVVTAIVMGIGSTLACFALTASLEKSALAWMSEHYRSDLVVSAKGAFLRILTAPTIAQEVVDQVAATDGVREVQGVRAIEVTVAERPAVLLAFDRAAQGFTLFDAEWSQVADRFWAGQGVLISDNLARLRTIERGDTIGLDTPSGRHRFRVLGTFPDYTGGSQLGSLAIARDTFKTIWADSLVNRIRLWIDDPSSAAATAEKLNARFSNDYGLYALTFSDVHDEIAHLIQDAFSIMYALVAVALVVSFVGITNFLITGLADRIEEVRVLHACGLSPRHTLTTVISEGVLVGAVGALLGVVAGAVASRIIVQQSVPMVTGWMFLYVFPRVPAVAVSIAAIVLAAAAGLPSGWLAMRWRHYAEGAIE